MEKIISKHYIKIVKGYDKNKKCFTAIVLLSDKQNQEFPDNFNERINLEQYNIIYKQFGHNFDIKIIDYIKEYCDKNTILLQD